MLLSPLSLCAQESQTAYNFLRLPVSAHAAALGGDNITIDDDDASLIFHNPSLINNASDNSINLNFMTYMEGARTASAAYVRRAGDRATWGAAAQFMDYGSMKETDYTGEVLGDFSAKDIAVSGTLAYALSSTVAGGITARIISSHIAGYSSLGVGVDLGLNYFNDESLWSLSAVAKNLGGQVKAYDDEFSRIPLDLQIGVSKRLQGSPLRLSGTLTRLNDWSDGLGRHLTIGADLILSQSIYLAAGYNFRRKHQMAISDDEGTSAHGAGLSLGAGLQLERFKLHMAYARYHVSASSLLASISYSL